MTIGFRRLVRALIQSGTDAPGARMTSEPAAPDPAPDVEADPEELTARALAALADEYRERLLLATGGATADTSRARAEIEQHVDRWLRDDGLSGGELHDAVLAELLDELCGLGPLEPLLADPEVTEIMVNAPDSVYVEVGGRLRVAPMRFRDDAQVRVVIERLLLGTGRRIDERSPLVDARLPDGSRVNAVLPPVAADSPVLTIRRRAPTALHFAELVDGGSISRQAAALLHAAVLGRCNLVVSGGAGAGKTTLLAALCALVPSTQRLLVLEDVSELAFDHPHVVRQECRPPSPDGAGEVGLRALVRNSLRMRPDRLIVGEVRGVEAADMVAALNTGQDGSMTTLHANRPSDALHRLETMLTMAWPEVGVAPLRSWIGAGVDLVVHCERLPSGRRVVSEIASVESGADASDLVATTVQEWRGGPAGQLAATGAVPHRCVTKMARHGVAVPRRIFAAAAA